jgi:hypothetical protein
MADVGQEEVSLKFQLLNEVTALIHLSGLRSRKGQSSQGRSQEVLPQGSYSLLEPLEWDLKHSLLSQDLKREFVTELIYPAVQANCIYEVRGIVGLQCT